MKNKLLLKGLLMAIALVLFVSPGCVSAFSENISEIGSDVEIGVFAKYVYNGTFNIIPIDEGGKGDVTLPDGTIIEIDGADSTKGQLVIDPITEREALDWIKSVVDGKVNKPIAFHIYYLDNDGNIKDADDITVTVKTGENLSDPEVYALDSDGNLDDISSSENDGKITFEANGDPYYIVGEKNESAVDTDDTDDTGDDTSAADDTGDATGTGDTGDTETTPVTTPVTSGDDDAPAKGDGSNVAMWIVIAVISMIAIVVVKKYSIKKDSCK